MAENRLFFYFPPPQQNRSSKHEIRLENALHEKLTHWSDFCAAHHQTNYHWNAKQNQEKHICTEQVSLHDVTAKVFGSVMWVSCPFRLYSSKSLEVFGEWIRVKQKSYLNLLYIFLIQWLSLFSFCCKYFFCNFLQLSPISLVFQGLADWGKFFTSRGTVFSSPLGD